MPGSSAQRRAASKSISRALVMPDRAGVADDELAGRSRARAVDAVLGVGVGPAGAAKPMGMQCTSRSSPRTSRTCSSRPGMVPTIASARR